MTRAAAVCSVLLGLGFWRFLGFPTYGEGPFERWGVPTTTGLLAAFVLVCAAEVVVGVMLWPGSTVALWLALALLPVELASGPDRFAA